MDIVRWKIYSFKDKILVYIARGHGNTKAIWFAFMFKKVETFKMSKRKYEKAQRTE